MHSIRDRMTGLPRAGPRLPANGVRVLNRWWRRSIFTLPMVLGLAVLAPTHAAAETPRVSLALPVSAEIAQAPDPFEPEQPDDAELLILKMTLDDTYELSDAVLGYANGGSLILPLEELVDALEFPIDVDSENGRAEGWFLDESRLFTLDISARQVIIDGRAEQIKPGFVQVLDDGIFVDVRTLSKWFPIDINFDLPNLLVDIVSREPLPLEQRLKRDLFRERVLSQNARKTKDFPRVDVPYEWISWPVSDTAVDVSVTSTDNGVELTRNYTTLATADILKLNTDIFMSGNKNDQVAIARVRFGRQEADGGLLGPLDATRFSFGDVFAPQVTHVANTQSGRGILVSNRPIEQLEEFDRITLQGDIQLGWEVELYRNEVLLDFRESDSDGRYIFEDIPLLFGVNVIKLIFYGPQGQKREDIRQIRVGPGQIAVGDHFYTVAANQKDTLTFLGALESQRSDDFQGDERFSVDYVYGLDTNLSVGLNFASLPLGGGRQTFAGTSFVGSLGPVFSRLDLTKDLTGGYVGTLSAQGRLFGITALAEHTYLNDFISEEFDNVSDPLKARTRLRFDGVARSDFLPHIPYALNLTHEANESGDRTTDIQNRLSTAVGRASISNTTTLTLNDPAETPDSVTASGSMQIGGVVGPVRTRGSLSYGLKPDIDLTSVTLSGDWKASPKFNASLGASRTLTGTPSTTYSLGLNTDLDYAAISVDSEYDDSGEYSATMRLSYSWGKDNADGGLRLSSTPTAERGTINATVFRDYNGDGVFTEGEDEPIENVRFVVDGSRQKELSNDKGKAFLTALPTYEPVDVELDVASLVDPFWIASPRGAEMVLRPGVPGEVQFAVVSTGEIDGIVYRNDGKWAEPVSKVRLELVDAQGTVVKEVRSQFDGFYLFDFIPPGTYTLQVSEQQLAELGLPDVPARVVEIGTDGTILSNEDIFIGGKPQETGSTQVRVVLAAFETIEQAQSAWTQVVNVLPDIFEGLEPAYDDVEKGAITFTRLFATGFEDRQNAEDACIDLRATLGETWCNPLDIQLQ